MAIIFNIIINTFMYRQLTPVSSHKLFQSKANIFAAYFTIMCNLNINTAMSNPRQVKEASN